MYIWSILQNTQNNKTDMKLEVVNFLCVFACRHNITWVIEQIWQLARRVLQFEHSLFFFLQIIIMNIWQKSLSNCNLIWCKNHMSIAEELVTQWPQLDKIGYIVVNSIVVLFIRKISIFSTVYIVCVGLIYFYPKCVYIYT